MDLKIRIFFDKIREIVEGLFILKLVSLKLRARSGEKMNYCGFVHLHA
jgi:hypothetical protein